MEKKGYNLEGELSLIPTNTVAVNDSELDQIIKLIDILEDYEDIQKVHTNIITNK